MTFTDLDLFSSEKTAIDSLVSDLGAGRGREQVKEKGKRGIFAKYVDRMHEYGGKTKEHCL